MPDTFLIFVSDISDIKVLKIAATTKTITKFVECPEISKLTEGSTTYVIESAEHAFIKYLEIPFKSEKKKAYALAAQIEDLICDKIEAMDVTYANNYVIAITKARLKLIKDKFAKNNIKIDHFVVDWQVLKYGEAFAVNGGIVIKTKEFSGFLPQQFVEEKLATIKNISPEVFAMRILENNFLQFYKSKRNNSWFYYLNSTLSILLVAFLTVNTLKISYLNSAIKKIDSKLQVLSKSKFGKNKLNFNKILKIHDIKQSRLWNISKQVEQALAKYKVKIYKFSFAKNIVVIEFECKNFKDLENFRRSFHHAKEIQASQVAGKINAKMELR